MFSHFVLHVSKLEWDSDLNIYTDNRKFESLVLFRWVYFAYEDLVGPFSPAFTHTSSEQQPVSQCLGALIPHTGITDAQLIVTWKGLRGIVGRVTPAAKSPDTPHPYQHQKNGRLCLSNSDIILIPQFLSTTLTLLKHAVAHKYN